jgi:hypothetical protein
MPSDLEQRVKRLERRTQWLTPLAIGLGALAVVLWNAQRFLSGPVRELVLADATGKRRAMLAVGEKGPTLILADEAGRPRIGLAVPREGPGMVIYDEAGNVRASLCAGKEGGRLTFTDERGREVWKAP